MFLISCKGLLRPNFKPAIVLGDEDVAFGRLGILSNSINNLILVGFKCNWAEFVNSKRFRDVVVPTKFSLLGAFNVQDTAEITNLSKEEKEILYEEIPDTRAQMGHIFVMEGNFGLHSGRIKFVDYGDKRTIGGLKKHGVELRRIFDLVQRQRGL